MEKTLEEKLQELILDLELFMKTAEGGFKKPDNYIHELFSLGKFIAYGRTVDRLKEILSEQVKENVG